MRNTVPIRTSAVLVALAATLAACSSGSSDNADSASASGTPTDSSSSTEARSATPRLALTYDGGVRLVDAGTLETVADLPRTGFLRLNDVGDGRHVMVTTDDGFAVLDAGTWRERHGDHSHYWTADPRFTGTTFAGEKPGHAVPHDGKLALFFDGTGQVELMDLAAIGEAAPKLTTYTTPKPHHGVAVARADGSLVVSVGDEESRSGVEILDSDRKRVASTDKCPGVHGEAAAAGGVLTFGCQDGIVTVNGTVVTKIDAPDDYGRIGNQRGSEVSPIILGDYKKIPSDKLADNEVERPRSFSLTDTRTNTLRVLELPTSYSFRSLARGPGGEALILGTDGALYVFDADTGKQVARHQVIGEWSEPTEWQDPMPLVTVVGSTAYISDPAKQTLTGIDIRTGKQTANATLDIAVGEAVGVTG